VAALIVGGDFESAPGAGGVLLEQQRDRAAGQLPLLRAVALGPLQRPGQRDQVDKAIFRHVGVGK
jgi:hypothetical protein